MKNILSVIIVFSFLSSHVWSQSLNANDEVESNENNNRPSVALVLSGAGPRGFAHIPIIELMEELDIPIDFVLGTSSGAIVGGLYSAGYSGKELAQTVLDIDWPMLLQDNTTHLLTSSLGSHSSQTNLLNIKLDGNLSLNLGGGLLTGQYVYSKLKSLTVKIPSYIDFDDLPVPYRATAVDLITGELVLLENGDLAEAMRSSMTLPGVFEPFPVDGRYYLDGFIKNTLPISAVRDLGYDIVIAIEISEELPTDASTLGSNPISVLNQVLALQQSSVTSQEYAYADLVLFPDLSEFGSADYAYSQEIYAKGKIEAEKFRNDLIELRSKIFQHDSDSVAIDEEQNVAMLNDDNSVYFRSPIAYNDLPSLIVDDIVLKNAFQYDENMILREFEKIKGKQINENDIETFLAKIYETSNYLMVTSRFNRQNESVILELEFYQKDFEAIRIGGMQTFEGVVSNSASWELSNIVTVQFNDFLGMGGVFSIQGMLLSQSGLELLLMQPLSSNVFLRAKMNAFQLMDIEHSGFSQTQVHASYFRQGNAAFALGVFFSPEHKLLNEIGFHWIDSSRHIINFGDANINGDDLGFGYALDFYSRYTFDTIDSLLFPTSGFYNDFMVMGVVPFEENRQPEIFEVLTNDTTMGLSLNKNVSIAVNAFIGTNISEVLNTKHELLTKYGFTTYDRVFFPHILQRYSYGIHKIALKADLQFQPNKALTVLGGQLFIGLGGAFGNVWSDYSDINSFDDIEWQTSALAGIRITETIGVVVRAGAGRYDAGVKPFASLDFMIKCY